MAEPEVNAFLTDLAVHGRVSASTQTQALYAHVLGRPAGEIDIDQPASPNQHAAGSCCGDRGADGSYPAHANRSAAAHAGDAAHRYSPDRGADCAAHERADQPAGRDKPADECAG